MFLLVSDIRDIHPKDQDADPSPPVRWGIMTYIFSG